MQGQDTAADSKLSALAEHPRSLRFNVKTGIKFEDQSAAITARRARVQFERGCLTEEFLMVAKFDSLDYTILNAFSRKCFRHALRNRRIPLPWGWLALHFATCYAVAMVPATDSALTSSLTRSEPILRWWYGNEFPIVWDLSTGCLYYPEATLGYGRVADMQRRVALELLAPVA